MASVQCVREELVVSQQLSCVEQSNVNEIIKFAENSCVSEDIENKSLAIVAENECMDKDEVRNRITIVAGGLKNQTKGDLNVLSSKKWAGHIVKNYPNPLHSMGAFLQSALSSKGVKAAVVYSGKNHNDVECAWLLAWADTKALGRRIYAECGPKNNFCNIDWNKIESKLDNSGAIIKTSDKTTGTSVYATIVGHSAKDVLAAAFCG